ncbi:MAG: D-inositol-3-phosphate glycosyltransferase [Acidimicrobiaceae bacterium]
MKRVRSTIAFFDLPDVFDDFYPPYGVTPAAFATDWDGTGTHSFATALQQSVGNVSWYVFSIGADLPAGTHALGFRVRFLRSSWLHRQLWQWFYARPRSWRRQRWWRAYGVVASYLAPLSPTAVRAVVRDRPAAIFLQDFATGRFDLAVLAGALLRIPVVAYHSGSLPNLWLGRSMRRTTLRRANRLIVQSEDIRRVLTEAGVDASRIVELPTPIDTARYRPRSRSWACQRLGLDPSRAYVLYMGRLDDAVKRVSSLIGVVGALARDRPDLTLLIAGDGPARSGLEAAARAAGAGRVVFLGWVDEPEVKVALLNAAHCLALPSRSEGAPTAVLEALACGTYVVATRVGAQPTLLVEGQTGTLVEPEDDGALERALEEALTAPEATIELRHVRRRTSGARTGLDDVGEHLTELFAELGVTGVR